MFVRKKKVKGYEYAYLVENRWMKRKKRAKQSSGKYLGRVLSLGKSSGDFVSFYKIKNVEDYVSGRKFRDVVVDLISFELISREFVKESGFLVSDDVVFNLDDFNFYVYNDEFNDKLNKKVKNKENLKINEKNYLKNRKTLKINKKKTKNFVIEMNEGFLCKYTLDKIFQFKYDEYISSSENGFILARLLVDAGLKIDNKLFVEMFKGFVKE